jgi:hypothetical protein
MPRSVKLDDPLRIVPGFLVQAVGVLRNQKGKYSRLGEAGQGPMSKSLGSNRSQTPPRDLKSGIPLSVLIPAPVRQTVLSAPRIHPEARAMRSSEIPVSGKPVLLYFPDVFYEYAGFRIFRIPWVAPAPGGHEEVRLRQPGGKVGASQSDGPSGDKNARSEP